MRIPGWLMIIAFGLVAAFAAVNWTTFTTPTALSLIVFDVYAPLGGIMLAVLAGLTLLALGFAASWRTSMLLESRRLSRELEAQRQLAEHAEASRVAELGTRIEAATQELKAANEAIPRAVIDRIDAFDASFRQTLGVAVNSVSAAVGELEDKVERSLAAPAART